MTTTEVRARTGLLRIDNLDVYCRDVARMRAFYRDTLGLDLLYPSADDDDWFAIQSGDVTVYFLAVETAEPRPTAFPPGAAVGISSFSFAVDDLDTAVAQLDGSVDWADEVRSWHHADGTWYRFRFFTDPEGNNLSVTEPHKAASPE